MKRGMGGVGWPGRTGPEGATQLESVSHLYFLLDTTTSREYILPSMPLPSRRFERIPDDLDADLRLVVCPTCSQPRPRGILARLGEKHGLSSRAVSARFRQLVRASAKGGETKQSEG